MASGLRISVSTQDDSLIGIDLTKPPFFLTVDVTPDEARDLVSQLQAAITENERLEADEALRGRGE